MFFLFNMDQKATLNYQQGPKRESKECQNEPREIQKHPLGNRVEKVRRKVGNQYRLLGIFVGQNLKNFDPQKNQTNIANID